MRRRILPVFTLFPASLFRLLVQHVSGVHSMLKIGSMGFAETDAPVSAVSLHVCYGNCFRSTRFEFLDGFLKR